MHFMSSIILSVHLLVSDLSSLFCEHEHIIFLFTIVIFVLYVSHFLLRHFCFPPLTMCAFTISHKRYSLKIEVHISAIYLKQTTLHNKKNVYFTICCNQKNKFSNELNVSRPVRARWHSVPFTLHKYKVNNFRFHNNFYHRFKSAFRELTYTN